MFFNLFSVKFEARWEILLMITFFSVCDPSQCTTTKPTCEPHHAAVITNPGECCPQYDCGKEHFIKLIKVQNWTYLTQLTCFVCFLLNIFVANIHQVFFLTVCRSDMCPTPPSCGLNERRERTNKDTECCGVYECKRK